MELKDNNSVKYIDVTHGSCEAYIRCDTTEAAQSLVQKNYEGRCLTILKGKYILELYPNIFNILINVPITYTYQLLTYIY